MPCLVFVIMLQVLSSLVGSLFLGPWSALRGVAGSVLAACHACAQTASLIKQAAVASWHAIKTGSQIAPAIASSAGGSIGSQVLQPLFATEVQDQAVVKSPLSAKCIPAEHIIMQFRLLPIIVDIACSYPAVRACFLIESLQMATQAAHDDEQGYSRLTAFDQLLRCKPLHLQVKTWYVVMPLEALEVVKNSTVKVIRALQTLSRLCSQLASDIARHR